MNTRGVAPTGTPGSGGTIVDGQGHVHYVSAADADAYLHKGFLNRVGQVAPYGIMAGMGYGALTGGTGGLSLLGSGGGGGIAPGMVTNTAPSLGAGFESGAGMKFGLGTLAKVFDSRGGTAAIDAAGQLLGGKMQANAYGKAADVQAQAAREALDFAKQQYALAIQQHAPFLQASQDAVGRLSNLPAPQVSHGQYGNTVAPYPQMTMTDLAPRSQSQGVTLKAPSGEVRQFAPNDPQIQSYLQRGAQRVA